MSINPYPSYTVNPSRWTRITNTSARRMAVSRGLHRINAYHNDNVSDVTGITWRTFASNQITQLSNGTMADIDSGNSANPRSAIIFINEPGFIEFSNSTAGQTVHIQIEQLPFTNALSPNILTYTSSQSIQIPAGTTNLLLVGGGGGGGGTSGNQQAAAGGGSGYLSHVTSGFTIDQSYSLTVGAGGAAGPAGGGSGGAGGTTTFGGWSAGGGSGGGAGGTTTGGAGGSGGGAGRSGGSPTGGATGGFNGGNGGVTPANAGGSGTGGTGSGTSFPVWATPAAGGSGGGPGGGGSGGGLYAGGGGGGSSNFGGAQGTAGGAGSQGGGGGGAGGANGGPAGGAGGSGVLLIFAGWA